MEKQQKRQNITPGSGSGGFTTPISISSPLSNNSNNSLSSPTLGAPDNDNYTTPTDNLSDESLVTSIYNNTPAAGTKRMITRPKQDRLSKTKRFGSLARIERFRSLFSTLKPMHARDIQVLSPEDQSNLQWASWLNYVLFVCSGILGEGDLVRFPLFMVRYGAVTFFSAYFIIFILVGYPMMLMEAGLGQFCSLGPGGCWEFAKLFQGLGYFIIMWNGYQSVFYIMKTMHWLKWQYDMLYFFSWEHLSSSRVYSALEDLFGFNQTKAENQNLSLTEETEGYTVYIIFDLNKARNLFEARPREDPDVTGLKIYVIYLINWIIVLILLITNIRTRGYIHSISFVISTLCIFVFCVRVLTLPGAISGIKYGILNNSGILNYEVWLVAFRHCFFSMSLMPGAHMTISSYNHFNNQIVKDVFFCGLVDLFFSGVGVIMMFSFLGNIAEMTTIDLDDVYKLSGDDLIFTYLLSLLELGLAWVFVFFTLMIVLLHLNVSVMFEVIITGIIDVFQVTTRKRKNVVMCVCSLLFIGYQWLCTDYDVVILRLFDYYTGPIFSTIFGMCLIGPVLYVFGVDRFLSMLECSVGWDASSILSNRWWKLWWKTCWMFFVPAIYVASTITLIYHHQTEKKEQFKPWMLFVGRTIWLSFPFVIFGTMIYLIATTHKGGFVARLRFLTTPTANWGPILPQNKYIVQVEEEDRLSKSKIQKRKSIFQYSQLSWSVRPSFINTIKQ